MLSMSVVDAAEGVLTIVNTNRVNAIQSCTMQNSLAPHDLS